MCFQSPVLVNLRKSSEPCNTPCPSWCNHSGGSGCITALPKTLPSFPPALSMTHELWTKAHRTILLRASALHSLSSLPILSSMGPQMSCAPSPPQICSTFGLGHPIHPFPLPTPFLSHSLHLLGRLHDTGFHSLPWVLPVTPNHPGTA